LVALPKGQVATTYVMTHRLFALMREPAGGDARATKGTPTLRTKY